MARGVAAALLLGVPSGLSPAVSGAVTIADPAPLDDVPIVMPVVSLSGPTVVDSGTPVVLTGSVQIDGVGVAGAAVTVTESGSSPVSVPVVSDPAGGFTVDMGRGQVGTRVFSSSFIGDPAAGIPGAVSGSWSVSVVPGAGSITLSAPVEASPDTVVPVTGSVSLATTTGAVAVPGAPVQVLVSGDGGVGWTMAVDTVTSPAGTFDSGVALGPGEWLVRADTSGTADVTAASSGPATVRVSARVPVVAVAAADRQVVSQRPTTITVTVTGAGAADGVITLQRRARTTGLRRAAPVWEDAQTLTGTAGAEGAGASAGLTASFRVTPWRANEYRAILAAVPGSHGGATSVPVVVTTRPRWAVSDLPAAAPAPRVRHPWGLRPVGHGANPRVQRVPPQVRRQLSYSWRPGCVPLSDLRYVTVNYRGFDGYRNRGELIVRADVARQVGRIFADLYRARFPIRQMVFPDRWGHNPKGPGADDYGSMRADNTSGFNCRYVVGRERSRVWSPHASGRSIDVNTWENPYAARTGIFPNSWFMWHRRGPGVFQPGARSTRAFTGRGWNWGGNWGSKDWQHFQR